MALTCREHEKVNPQRRPAAVVIIIVWAALIFALLFWNGDRW
jgi:hypothetical protein